MREVHASRDVLSIVKHNNKNLLIFKLPKDPDKSLYLFAATGWITSPCLFRFRVTVW